ncbi:MAG: NAD(P)-dependent oxidoreductase [Alphaproteobacteria bacterium]
MARLPILAVLGATSRMAQDLAPLMQGRAELKLFARNGALPYADFATGAYDAVINFVGVGDPSRAKSMGDTILSITQQYDEMALDYLADHPGTRYIFLSSGAAYGGDFQSPARDGGETVVAPDGPQNYYGAAKQQAETRHRALPGQIIFDLRVFNYVSRAMDLSASFLLSDMVRCARDGTVFRTSDRPMARDFLHPADFAQMVECCLTADGNMALDCYSQAPITKRELLELMASRFGMRYEVTQTPPTANITGEKPLYYSQSRRAAAVGYAPVYSSQSAIATEVGAILAGS